MKIVMEECVVDGVDGEVMYLDANHNPTTKDEAVHGKVRLVDGRVIFVDFAPEQPPSGSAGRK